MMRSWIIGIVFISWRLCIAGAATEMTIYPTFPAGYVIRRVGDVLNITCVINSTDGGSFADFQLSWKVPLQFSSYVLPTGSQVIADDHKSLTLVINPLMESDSGVYICRAVNVNASLVQANVTVKIKPKKGSCSLPFFLCGSKECLPSRYVCDGKSDCKDGSDEDRTRCGGDPCLGKMYCSDGRCRPVDQCCDGFSEDICQTDFSHHCCNKNQPQLWTPKDLVDQQKKYDSDMGFLQSTIYTIIGCAVAFIFVVTIMVVAVCRVHMKQNAMTTAAAHHPRALLPLSRTLYWSRRLNMDEPAFRSASSALHPPSTSLLVTYNINNGVQLVGHLTDPPPYSEVADPPPVYGPPPPYVSCDHLNELPTRPPNTSQQQNVETAQSTSDISP